jgi:hypothetical protein
VSVEAISWALNLAPVPRDRGGKPNPACKAVLIGLANHAGPDGKEAFPAVRTLIRYTCLSERTVRTALDRLQAEGIITACDPGAALPVPKRRLALLPAHRRRICAVVAMSSGRRCVCAMSWLTVRVVRR